LSKSTGFEAENDPLGAGLPPILVEFGIFASKGSRGAIPLALVADQLGCAFEDAIADLDAGVRIADDVAVPIAAVRILLLAGG
jgi:hypothetical protein